MLDPKPKPKLKPKPKPTPKPPSTMSRSYNLRNIESRTNDSTGFVVVLPSSKRVAPSPGTYTRHTLGTLLKRWVQFIRELPGKFKIGITGWPVYRSRNPQRGGSYRDQFPHGHMYILGRFQTGEGAGAMEASLIFTSQNDATLKERCQNKAGGDDGRKETSVFLYVVSERPHA